MKLTSLTEINSAINELELFEAILLDIRWSHYGLRVELLFIKVSGESTIGSDIGENSLITLAFHMPDSFLFESGFSSAMRTSPEKINWGINEVSSCTIQAANPVQLADGRTEMRFNAVLQLCENRHIAISFALLEIFRSSLSDARVPFMTTF
jgi:hypothetical protein